MNAAQYILLGTVKVYRAVLSPALGAFFGPGQGCRFTPTCSAYAAEAISTHGAVAGSWLAAKRVCRCHPWGGDGHDPVPEKNSAPATSPTSGVTPASVS